MTATQIQFRRGTAAEHAAFTGAEGEITVDTTNNRAVVHDGATAGGHSLATVDEMEAYVAAHGSGDMLAANNLSEIVDEAAARNHLGLGTVATLDATDVVRADSAQDLTVEQQEQARTNISGVGVVRIQKFIASGTYVPDPNLVYAIIECVGGGGGGGGAAQNSSSQNGAGGGGSGGYARKIATLTDIGISKTVVIGAGGNGGAATGANGSAGSATSVDTLCVANGGAFGLGAGDGGSGLGGNGAGIGTGDIAIGGNPGWPGRASSGSTNVNTYYGGAGGDTPFGFGAGGPGVGPFTPGKTGTGYGAGGSGGSGWSSVGEAGGNGASGFVLITEFCTR